MFYPALEELMKEDLEARWQAGLREGRQAGLQEGRQAGRREGIFGAVGIYRDEMGLDDNAIISKIAARFHLTIEQATRYVRTQEAQAARLFTRCGVADCKKRPSLPGRPLFQRRLYSASSGSLPSTL